MSRLDRITPDASVCHGKPVIRGLRYPVQTLLELLASGMAVEEVLVDYPDLERDNLLAALEFAALTAGGQAVGPLAPGEVPRRCPLLVRLPARLSDRGHDVLHTSSLPDGNRSTDQHLAALTDQDARVVVTNDADFRHSHLLTGSPARLLVVATGNIGNDDLVSTWRIRALPLCRSSRGSSGGVGFREPAVATGGDRWWQSHNDDGVPAAVGCASPFTQGGSQGPMIYERPCAHCGQMILTPETAAEPLCLDCDPALAGDAEAE